MLIIFIHHNLELLHFLITELHKGVMKFMGLCVKIFFHINLTTPLEEGEKKKKNFFLQQLPRFKSFRLGLFIL